MENVNSSNPCIIKSASGVIGSIGDCDNSSNFKLNIRSDFMSNTEFNKKEFDSFISKKENWLQKNNKYKCPICDKEYTKYGISNHLKYHFGFKHDEIVRKSMGCSNRGKTKENCQFIRNRIKKFKERYSNGEITAPWSGKTLSEEHKRKISEKLKIAHKEGRAGHWNNNKIASYPEKFFMKIIKNEFIDKNYIYNYRVDNYFLDFAWGHIKKYIEIDGEQHYRNSETVNYDENRNSRLKECGWQVLRIRWKDIVNDTQKYINIAKNFIDNDIEHLENNLKKYQNEIKELERIKQQKEIDKVYEIAIKVNKIIDSNIDFTKYGWVEQVNKITGQTNSRRWIKRWCPWLLENVYCRNKTNI